LPVVPPLPEGDDPGDRMFAEFIDSVLDTVPLMLIVKVWEVAPLLFRFLLWAIGIVLGGFWETLKFACFHVFWLPFFPPLWILSTALQSVYWVWYAGSRHLRRMVSPECPVRLPDVAGPAVPPPIEPEEEEACTCKLTAPKFRLTPYIDRSIYYVLAPLVAHMVISTHYTKYTIGWELLTHTYIFLACAVAHFLTLYVELRWALCPFISIYVPYLWVRRTPIFQCFKCALDTACRKTHADRQLVSFAFRTLLMSGRTQDRFRELKLRLESIIKASHPGWSQEAITNHVLKTNRAVSRLFKHENQWVSTIGYQLTSLKKAHSFAHEGILPSGGKLPSN
jgi:hypothetical protein